MFRKISIVFSIMSLIVAFGFLKNILLARGLSKSDLGLFTLIMTLAGLIYPVAMLGQQNAILRLLSKFKPSEYNWKCFFLKLLLLAFCITIAATTIFTFFYDFGNQGFIFLIIVIASSIIADLYTYIFRAAGQYERSIFLHRSLRIFFPIVLVIIAYLNRMELGLIFQIFAILYGLHALVIIYYTINKVASGKQRIPKTYHKEGLFILSSDLAMLVIISIDKLFLARLVDLESVGEYFAIFSVTRIFELALHSIDFVLIPQSNRMDEININKIVLKVSTIGLLISGFYMVLGRPIIHYLYSGKYDSSVYLIPFFCLIGLLQLLHVVPSSIIKGRLGQKALRSITIYDSTLMLISIFITYYFISVWQLVGALIATTFMWSLRVFFTFIVFRKHYPSSIP